MSSEDEYWVGPTIGEGSFGHVVYAVHKSTERKVAIKVMEVPNARRGNAHRQNQQNQKTRMILNERRILGLPSIKSSRWTVDLWAAFLGKPSASTQCLYFVMKLATGGDLAGLIRRGLDEPSHRRSWLQHSVPFYSSQLIRAVDFLHTQGIVHCDLKPENLLLDASTGNLLLADFGASLDTTNLQQPPKPAGEAFPRGTALYAAPEVLRALETTVAVDYWSVGCVLHAMRHGSSPFDRGSEALTVAAILDYDDGRRESWEEGALFNSRNGDEIEAYSGQEDFTLATAGAPSTETSEGNETCCNEEEDDDDRDPIQRLSHGLLVVNPDDRISAWKDKAVSFLSSTSYDSDDNCNDVLLPVPVWQEKVENSTLRDGSLGWHVFQI